MTDIDDKIRFVVPIMLDDVSVRLGPWSGYHVLAQHQNVAYRPGSEDRRRGNGSPQMVRRYLNSKPIKELIRKRSESNCLGCQDDGANV